MAYVEGIGQELISGLSEADFNREIKYVAIASAQAESYPMFPLLVDEIYLNYEITSSPAQPSISDVEDFEYEAGTSDNVIVWSIANFTPTSYELWRDGGLLTLDAWPGGSLIEVDIDNLAPGGYNYTIIVYGDNDVVVSDIVYVTVIDSTSPSLGHPLDIIYEFGTTGHEIIWSSSDLYPNEYTIYLDEVYFAGDTWTPGSIVLDIDGLALGEYNYTIKINDTAGNLAVDTVIVTVVDTTSPLLNHPLDVPYEFGTTGHEIIWTVSDLNPDAYAIYLDGVYFAGDTWTPGSIVVDIDGLALGEYNYTIRTNDTIGNSAADTVIVTIVDTTSPIINHPSDILGDFGATSIQITWQPTDLLPLNYVIYQNGTQISSGTWISGENLTYTLESLSVSSYNITIVVWDTSGNYATDTVFISIEEGSIPGIGDYLVIIISFGSLGVIVIIIGLICRNKGGPKQGSPSSYDW